MFLVKITRIFLKQHVMLVVSWLKSTRIVPPWFFGNKFHKLGLSSGVFQGTKIRKNFWNSILRVSRRDSRKENPDKNTYDDDLSPKVLCKLHYNNSYLEKMRQYPIMLLMHSSFTIKLVKFCLHIKDYKWGRKWMFCKLGKL